LRGAAWPDAASREQAMADFKARWPKFLMRTNQAQCPLWAIDGQNIAMLRMTLWAKSNICFYPKADIDRRLMRHHWQLKSEKLLPPR
jgi:hypothetical protein